MAPEAPHRNRTPRYVALGTGALVAGALTYIGLADPHRPGFVAPPCPFLHLTGWFCPGCGGLRMTHDLMHGDVAAAAADNVYLLVGLPLLALWALVRRRQRLPVLPVPAVIVIAASAVAWTVVRNLPGFPLVPTLLTG
ncbi:DUF2752 domain-containing protein [Mycolicibacterium sp. S2-37]|uniref:DUF2752 domain-containing protein n=1 Tax=Mycolicibacterium sp. S2-37 TaxID=2810297 RepID=UPI001A950C9A|nr:DUF2752 domain-containing protein [Mycolicibacterium sp. S2-37]MBO0680578.1 DUF2752 domain-containing protein [Mycolicibacterium sp. S2-37]